MEERSMSQTTQFILNNRDVVTSEPAGMLVLDYLRRREHLVGTKEGCKEGDCGACVVLVGELTGTKVKYKPVTSCLMPLGELHGKHLVTIEGLNMAQLTPVQQAIVDEGGSQCGFCTPGIVVSLTGYLMNAAAAITDEGIKYALGGNLCRCTGYGSLKRAGSILIQQFGNGSAFANRVKSKDVVAELIRAQAIPEYFKSIPARLKKIPKNPILGGVRGGILLLGGVRGGIPLLGGVRGGLIIAGGTDLYVQRGDVIPDTRVNVLNLHPEMKGIAVKNGKVKLGALTTFEEFADHPSIIKIIPGIKEYMHLNASWQIRNRATLGGNIVNASPIGDMTALLLALESTLVLKNGRKRRTVPMKSFFKGYKILDKKPNEILTEIIFPRPKAGAKIHFEKVSKRKTLDIASVNSAIKVRAPKGVIAEVELSMGGVAPVPLFMKNTCAFLKGKPVTRPTISDAIQVAMKEISPISDIRGAAEYKRLLARQLIIAHFTKLFPEFVTVRDFYEAH
jgi:xanthine dehydrogenase small subunit